MVVVPLTTSRSNSEDSDCDDESIRPKSSEDEVIQSQQTGLTIVGNRGEEVSSIDGKGCG